MKVMFLDESGNHDLRKINPTYPVFVLGGVIVDRAHLRNTIEPEMREFNGHVCRHQEEARRIRSLERLGGRLLISASRTNDQTGQECNLLILSLLHLDATSQGSWQTQIRCNGQSLRTNYAKHEATMWVLGSSFALKGERPGTALAVPSLSRGLR